VKSKPEPESPEQTLIKLSDRAAFLERANSSLSKDWHAMRDEFELIGRIIGGHSGGSLAVAVESRLSNLKRELAKRTATGSARLASRLPFVRGDSNRDTVVISDELLASLVSAP
jgi:hypothetical protein